MRGSPSQAPGLWPRGDAARAWLRGRRVLIVGAGVTGRALVSCCLTLGATPLLTDRVADRLAIVGPSQRVAWEVLGAVEADLVVLSPGVPRETAGLDRLTARGVPLMGELEFAWRLTASPFLCVTGTNGKSTTTVLLGRLLAAGGCAPVVGGNLGTPMSALVDQLTADRPAVVEVSSFHIEGLDVFRPDLAILLNISEDHLDRHGDLGTYRRLKEHLLAAWGGPLRGSVLCIDSPFMADLAERLRASSSAPVDRVATRARSDVEAWIGERGRLILGGERPEELVRLDEVPALSLGGRTMAANVLAAALAARRWGVPLAVQREVLRRFEGLPHRLERVAEVGGVTYVDDSKATNPGAAVAALRAFEDRGRPYVWWIVGGAGKGLSFSALPGAAAGKVRAVVAIGAAAAEIDEAFAGGATPVIVAGALDRALDLIAAEARPGDVALLAPACASFDQFDDYAHRGRVFRELVARLGAPDGAEVHPV